MAALLHRELLSAQRCLSQRVNPLVFFIMVVSLFPLAITPEADTLAMLAPGVIWVAALLAILLSLQGLFQRDYEEGNLEQLLLSPQPLWEMTLHKVLSHWLVSGLPLLLLAPMLGMMLHMNPHGIMVLCVSLLLGTPLLALIGGFASALILCAEQGSVLLSLLVLPLFIPCLVFGTDAVACAQQGLHYGGQLAIIAAMLCLALVALPGLTGAAVKIGVNQQ